MRNRMSQAGANRAVFETPNRMLVTSPIGGDLTVRGKPTVKPQNADAPDADDQA